MLSSIKSASPKIYAKQPFLPEVSLQKNNDLQAFLGCLSQDEQKKLQEKLTLSKPELSKLWGVFLKKVDSKLLRQFLDINKSWHGLFNEVQLNKIIQFLANNKIVATLWCRFISEPINCSEPDFINKINQFDDFINLIIANNIQFNDLCYLQQLKNYELDDFFKLFKKSSNKYMQIKFAYPLAKNIPLAIYSLEKDCKFINNDIINCTRNINNGQIVEDANNFLNFIINSTSNNINNIKILCLSYFALHTNHWDKFEPCLLLLNKAYINNQISCKASCIILKFAFLASNKLSQEQTFAFTNNSMKAYRLIEDRLFNLINVAEISIKNLTILEEIYKAVNYLVKMQVDIDWYSYNSLPEAFESIETIRLKYIKSTTQERLLEEVLAEFRNKNTNVAFPLDNIEINIIANQFLQIKKFEEEFFKLSQSELVDLIKNIKDKLNFANTQVSSQIKEENMCKLIAIANRAFVQYFNIYPYNVQILTVLGILLPKGDFKGRLAQVKTGEGKSTILALLMLVLASEGKCVDIITSTEYLAKRDEIKYKQFFSFFEIPTSNVCDADIKSTNFSGQIVYGTNYNFEFSILFDKLYLTGSRVLYNNQYTTRPFQVIIVDEVDNMLVDKALHSARIAYQGDQGLATIYPVIYDYIEKSCKFNKPNLEIIEQCKNLVKNYLLSEITLNQLIESAYKACFEHHLNVHYCIKKIENHNNSSEDSLGIVIIDQDTGRLNDGSRWQHGLHQFLEYKHNLPIKEETLTLGALSHPAFFSYYEEIYGVTGTIGTDIERNEIAEIYNLTTFDVPTYKPTLRKQLKTMLYVEEKAFKDFLLDEVKSMIDIGRPCLILCASVVTSDLIYKLIKNNINKSAIQLLNDMQHEEEEFIVEKAGNKSIITIATNAAGRGTDISLSQDVINKEGLHVIFTFFPSNERIEAQGAGRAGRQGNPGSYRILIPHDDDLMKLANSNKKPIELEQLINFRNKSIQESSLVRRNSSSLSLIKHTIFEKFCNWYKEYSLSPNFNKHIVLSKWADFYTNLENNDPIIKILENSSSNLSKISLIKYEEHINESFANFMANVS